MVAVKAFSFVPENFGMAIAAKIPMITTTIINSINVKPRRFIGGAPWWRMLAGRRLPARLSIPVHRR